MENNYETIKKACIDANPKILDLVFGCEVIGDDGLDIIHNTDGVL